MLGDLFVNTSRWRATDGKRREDNKIVSPPGQGESSQNIGGYGSIVWGPRFWLPGCLGVLSKDLLDIWRGMAKNLNG